MMDVTIEKSNDTKVESDEKNKSVDQDSDESCWIEANSPVREGPAMGTPSKRYHYRAPNCLGLLSMITLVLAAVIALAVMVPRIKVNDAKTAPLTPVNTNPSPSKAPQASPTRASVKPPPVPSPTPATTVSNKTVRLEAIRSFLVDQGVKSQDDFDNVESPQTMTLQWLAEDEYLSNLTISSSTLSTNVDLMELIQNRYITALFYYANAGDDWLKQCNFLSNQSICLWNDLTANPPIGVFCDPLEVRLSYNYLQGTIPSEVGKLVDLKVLDLTLNYLNGTIPASITRLTELTTLLLNNNILNGTIPTELGLLTRLELLDLHSNFQMVGTIPSELGMLTDLTDLELNDNNITGTIPTELGQLTRLRDCTLALNSLSGPIPTELGKLQVLKYLDLQSNQLNGTVPTVLASLANLTELYLQEKNLFGNLTPLFCTAAAHWDNIDADCNTTVACSCCDGCF